MSELDKILEFTGNIDAYEETPVAKQQIKNMLLKKIDEQELPFLDTPLKIINAEALRLWVNNL